MLRRRYLALSTLLVAGCGGQQEEETETPTRTATPTPTETPTATPTETPTRTPTAAEQRANEAIAEVQSSLDAAVRQYGGSDSDDIVAMDAAGDFSSRLLAGTLEDVVEELERAREVAVTQEQRTIVERLTVAYRFLSLAFEVQNGLVTAYFNLTDSRRFLVREDASETRDRVRRIGTQRNIIAEPFQAIREETSAEAVAVVPRLDPATYRAKVAQFDAEITGFGTLRTALDRFANGVALLAQARRQRENDPEDAERSATRATETLAGVADDLRAFVSSAPTAGDSLVPVADDFASLAAEKTADAREIAESL